MRGKEGAPNKETTPPCHWLFDLKLEHPEGGTSAACLLQADSEDEIPPEASNIRAVREGDVIQIRPNLERWPVEVLHSHESPRECSTFLGYRWTGTTERPFKLARGLWWQLNNPIPEPFPFPVPIDQ